MINIKALVEKKNKAIEDMTNIVKAAEAEGVMSEENQKLYDQAKKDCDEADALIAKAEEVNKMGVVKPEEPVMTVEDREVQAFADYIRGVKNEDITKGDNGALIPKTVANKIIDRLKDISPIFNDATRYGVKGGLSIPYVDAATDNITVAYASEFTDLTAVGTATKSVDLGSFLAGALCKVSRSLINNSDIDVVNFVVGKMAQALAVFFDQAVLVGKEGKATGLSTLAAEQKKTAAAANAVTLDELVEVQGLLESAYQAGAYWVMNPKTFTALKKLEIASGNFQINDVIENGFSGKFLGKPVYTSDQMPEMATGKTAVYYVNPAEAIAVNLVEDSAQVLNEVYAAQHAVGIVDWVEFDCKIQNEQAAAALVMA